MKKWGIPVVTVAALVILAFTARWWAPALLGFVSDNSDLIQGLTDLVQLVLWTGAAIVAVISFLRGRRQPPADLAQPTQPQAHVEGSGAIAQNHSVAGGQGSFVANEVNDAAIATGAGGRAIKTQTYIENLENLPDPDTARRNEAMERYLRRLRQRCNVLPLAAVGGDEETGDEVTLDRVYVALDTQTRAPLAEGDRRRRAPAGEPELDALGRMREERPLPALEAATEGRLVVLLGDPGSGKSTFVRQLAAWLAAAHLGEGTPPDGWPRDTVPVLVALRELAPALAALSLGSVSDRERDRQLVAIVRQHWKAEMAEMAAPDCAEALEQALDGGNVLLIFDGLDEVAERLRPRARQAVQAAAAAFPAVSHVIVTSRIRSYAGRAVLPGFTAHTLAPFDQDKIGRFVGAWYEAQAELGRMTFDKAREDAADLRRAALSSDLRELASNPMLLTTMAIVHQKEIGLPKERVRLYSKAVEVLLVRWQKRKGIAVSEELAAVIRDDLKMRSILELIAYMAHQRQARSRSDDKLERGDLVTLLEKPEYLGKTALASDFLDYVDLRAGLLVGHGGGEEIGYPQTYSFPHRTFQEYLAGCHMIAGRGVAREYRQRAAEGDYWALAAQYGAEEMLYNRRVPENLFDLAYQLCPAAGPTNQGQWRALLWSGQIAALVTRPAIEADTAGPDGSMVYLERLIPRLLEIMRGDSLRAVERAEAGRALARLGDSRIEVLDPLEMEFLDVPAGPFLMGTRSEDVDDLKRRFGDYYPGYEGEIPQHQQPVPAAFRIARYPVTNAQFAAFVATGGYREPNYWREAAAHGYWRPGQVRRQWFEGSKLVDEWASAPADYGEVHSLANHPVVGVCWWEALAFARWLTGRLHTVGRLPADWQVRLPSEVEWEKAARGGDGRDFPWGDAADLERTNFARSQIGTTSAVGCFPGGASPWQVEEMSGNVWEWTRSLYDTYPYPTGGKSLQQREDLTAGDSHSRVLRGGAFDLNEYLVRCAARSRDLPYNGGGLIGFRVCASP